MTRYLRAANVKDGKLDLASVLSMNFSPKEQAAFSLKHGDVLVTEGSGSIRTVGATSVWRGELDGVVCFQNTLLRLRPRPGTDSDFLGWWARAAHARGLFASIATGANIYHISAERVRALHIELPSLEEQRRIADFLDAELGNIDTLSHLRRLQGESLIERSSAYVSDSFPTDGSVDMVRLGYLARIQSGITVDGSRSTNGDVVTRPYLRVANVQAGRLALDSVTHITVPKRAATSSTLCAGDVLMTEGGDLDKLGRGTVWNDEIQDCLHQNHVFAVRPGPALDSEYLALLTSTTYARRYFESTGTKTTNLASTSSSKIRDFRIPLIPIGKQKAIVEHVRARSAQESSLMKKLERQQIVLEERRRALITAAVTGQMDVTAARSL